MSEDFTPGPWRVEEDTTLVWGACTFGEDGVIDRLGVPVADAQSTRTWGAGWANGKPSEVACLANAHLIAAAPCMYAALKAARTGMANAIEVIGSRRGDPEFDTLLKIDAALSKALGEAA